MSDTLRSILENTRKLVAEKRAEFEDPSSKQDQEKQGKGLEMDGAGDDSPKTRGHALEADEAALTPSKQPAVSGDANAEPSSGGAGTPQSGIGQSGKEREGNETDRDQALEADEPSQEGVTKKPAISGDANAKAATDETDNPTAKLANEILADVQAYQKEAKGKKCDDKADTGKEVSAEKTKGEPGEAQQDINAAKKAEDAKSEEGKTEDGKSEDGKSEDGEGENKDEGEQKKAEDAKSEEGKTEDGKSEDGKSDEGEGKQAEGGPQLELTTDVLAKIAAMTLSTEEGAEFVEGMLSKQAGAEGAQQVLGFLAEQSDLAIQQAEMEKGAADAQALITQQIFAAGQESGRQQAVVAAQKQAEAAPQDSEDVYVKLGQAVADASMEDLMAGAGQGGYDVDPAALAGAEGGEEAAMAGGDEEVSPEDLEAALAELVAEGTLSEEEAAQVLEYIAGAGGEEEAAGAAEMGGAEDAAAAMAAGEGEQQEVTASAQDLLTAIRNVRQSRS